MKWDLDVENPRSRLRRSANNVGRPGSTQLTASSTRSTGGNCPRDGFYGGRIVHGTCFSCGYDPMTDVKDEFMLTLTKANEHGPRF